MLFSDDFLSEVDSDPIGTIVKICGSVIDQLDLENQEPWTESDKALLLEAVALIDSIMEKNDIGAGPPEPNLGGSTQETCNRFFSYIQKLQVEFLAIKDELALSTLKRRYRTQVGATFSYEFSQGDLDRVQTLVNELREKISEVRDLETEHKQRLLHRLEKLQSELHKRVSDLDRFWGMVGDAGVVLGKLGTDAKPIVDRIKEVTEIVWKTQARSEELPSDSPSPLLGHDGEPDE